MGRTCLSFPKLAYLSNICDKYICVFVCACMHLHGFKKIKGITCFLILNYIKSKIYSLRVLQSHFTVIPWILQYD